MSKISQILTNKKISPNDKIYTPLNVAKKMIDLANLKPNDYVLDPSFGGGVFFNNFPDYVKKDFCEIEMEKDFFNWKKKVDCIIGNPPYSLWTKWLEHTMKLTNKFCYIFGVYNFTPQRLHQIHLNNFGLIKMEIIRVDWWFSYSFICVFEKNKKSIISVEPKVYYCDICGKRCGRGRKGNAFNECTNSPSQIKK